MNSFNPQVLQLEPIRVVMLRHTGSYDDVGPVFDQLFAWVTSHGVPVLRTIGIYWDNPDYVPTVQLRSAACVEVPPDFRMADRGGLNISIEEIAGGPYATVRFVGPYEELAPVWTRLTSYVEGSLRRQISAHPAFEVYVNDASTTPSDQLVTELYMPLV